MEAKIYVNGVIGVDCSLIDVIRQLKSYDKPTAVNVVLNSVGGSVSEGQAIFTYLRNLKIPVTTVAEKAYSIASVIFMAGDTRLVEEGARRLMVHLPWASVEGGADRLESVANKLRQIEEEFTNFYSTYTNIDKDSIKTLLKNETFLSGEEAVEMGFATEVVMSLEAVALVGDSFDKEDDTKENKMNKAEKFYGELKKLFTIMEDNTEFKALILQDANGVEINFTEVEDGAEPQVGDVATVDNSPAEGEYTAPNGDIWVFEAGALKEIKVAEAPAEEEITEETEEEASTEKEPNLKELLDKLLGLESSVAELKEQGVLKDAEIVALKESFEGLKSTTDELAQVRAELSELKKLIGSEEVIVAQTETKTNQRKSNGLINIIRG